MKSASQPATGSGSVLHAAYRTIGQSVPPKQWEQRATGTAQYASDVFLPGLLTARVVRSIHPHARLIGIDTRGALRMPGVHAVITAADFPADARYLHVAPAYADRAPLARNVVRYLGEEVAAVAADTADQARLAAQAVRVRYKPLRAPLSVDDALQPGAARLHERSTGQTNVSIDDMGAWGDLAAATSGAPVSVSGTYYYPRVGHACMETNAAVAHWHPDSETLELWTSTQAPWFVRREVAHVLGLRENQVIPRDVAVGGGFGAKSKICEHEALAALLSIKTGRPVRLVLDRDEDFAMSKPRHSATTDLTTHATREGRITAFEADLRLDNGAYNHYGPSVLKIAIKTLGISYQPEAAKWRARLVDTATTPGGQFRGYGHPQVGFAVESQVDEVAEALGIDPLELRIKNANPPWTTTLSGAKIRSSLMRECLETVRSELDWDRSKRERTPFVGVGVAAGMHGNGAFAHGPSNRSDAAIDLFADGRARVRFGGADAGTGQRTILAQIAAEELGLSVDDVDVVMMDGELTPFDMGAWSSRGTHMGGHAVRKAAGELADELRRIAESKVGSPVVLDAGRAMGPDDELPIGDLVVLSGLGEDGVLSHESSYVDPIMEAPGPDHPRPNGSASYTFAAHGVRVEVDPATGVVTILDYVAAHDVGRAINPKLAESQVTGGTVQGIGAALGEELVLEGGRVANDSYVDYPLPRAAGSPRVRTFLLEGPEDASPYDAKSVGEMPICLPGAAIANAVYDAIGIRFRSLPITPDKILSALAERDGATIRPRPRRRPRHWWVELVRGLYPLGLHYVLKRWGTRLFRIERGRRVESLVLAHSLDEARNAARANHVPLGGGTDVMARQEQGLLRTSQFVSLGQVTELRQLSVDDGGLEIGSAVTLSELAEFSRSRWPTIADAIETIASAQLRNVATVGGNLAQEKRCWFYRSGFPCYKRNGISSPCFAVLGDHRFHHAAIGAHRCQAVTPSDLASIFLALDAKVVYERDGVIRTVEIGDFYTGPGETVLQETDLILSIRIGAAALDRRLTFEKLRLWEGDFALVSVAVSGAPQTDGRVADARVVLGGVAPTPWRARATERYLQSSGLVGIEGAARAEMQSEGHPLERNGWKLLAAANLITRAVGQLEAKA